MRFVSFGLVAISVMAADRSFADDASDASFFEAKVRPLLISKCLECHGAEKPKSGLRLDSRDAILGGGESGPAAISGKPAESLLIDVISYRNSIQMPPKAKLPDGEIAILTEWVRRGLPWPNSETSTPTVSSPGTVRVDFTDEQKSHWAFQPVARATPPKVNDEAWIRSPIDRFTLAGLEAKNLTVSREADRATLLRRVTIDLVGLPPSPDDVVEFVTDQSPDSLERVVDRLLASPRYAERWARHWLDVARYADSNGLDENLAYANAFRYRDYVVKSMREDKPYDRFLLEQFAGDLLVPTEASSADAAFAESDIFDPLVATGFLCLGAKMLAEDDPVKMQMDIIDEQVDTIARAVMGLTMGCARCHDHKYDPLTTEDYYGLAGVFKSTQTMDTFTVVAVWHERPLATAQQEQQRNELRQIANKTKQDIEKLKTETTEAILSAARKCAGAYLLAATRELRLADQLAVAIPHGNSTNPLATPGAILIEAEEYERGNVIKDRDNYGKEIGVLVNRGETPNFAEYEIHLGRARSYQFELRYAAASPRPVKLFVNGRLIKPDAANRTTGSWTPESQRWFVECLVNLRSGRNIIRLEQPQFFPHLDKILLTPVERFESDGDESVADALAEENAARVELLPSVIQQWVKVLQATRSNPKSILAAWHEFAKDKQLIPDLDSAENGTSRLLGDVQPASNAELANRYERLFVDAEKAWTDLKTGDAGQKANFLSDPVLESARKLIRDPKGPFRIPADIESSFPVDIAARLKSLRDEQTVREQAIPKYQEVMAVAESKPENLKIHLRGSHLTLGREVPRQLPRILRGSTSRELSDGSGRLQLARWLVKPEHPLTARVMANRIWQWHFGHGLVRSPDNFGRLGERPSHPELLDWLASEFSGHQSGDEQSPHNWSMKALHRKLIGTATYRQSTELNASASIIDPENRLLWRFNRQRMDAEVLRDSLLALSGHLDETSGGSLLPTANRKYVTSTANVNPTIYNSNRRSIYLPVVRSALYNVFTAFDFADPSTLAGQRDHTTVAPQALFMMNSEFVLEQARAIATQLIRQPAPLDRPGRICRLYELVYGRAAFPDELDRASAYLDRIHAVMKQSGITDVEIDLRAWTSLCRAVLSTNEFLYVE